MILTEDERGCLHYICFWIFLRADSKIGTSASRILNFSKVKADIPTELLGDYKEDFDILIEVLEYRIRSFKLDPNLNTETLTEEIDDYSVTKTAYDTIKKLRGEIK